MKPLSTSFVFVLSLLALGGSAQAAAHDLAANPFADANIAVADESLARIRGGYSGNGLDVSFGIDHAIYVNGALATSTTLNVTASGTAISVGGANVTLQTGAGNSVASAAISQTSAGTVVQNTLDGQKLQNVTTINAVTNGLSLYRNLNLGASMQSAVINSLRR